MLIKLIQLSEVRSKTHGWLEAAKGRLGVPAGQRVSSCSIPEQELQGKAVEEGKGKGREA